MDSGSEVVSSFTTVGNQGGKLKLLSGTKKGSTTSTRLTALLTVFGGF